MAQVKDQVKFDISQGLDQDSFPSESFAGGWYNALNVLFYAGLQGKNKVASNSIGNIVIPNEDLLDLAWKPVWEELDRETNYLYFLLKHAASSTYQIWRLIEDNVFELVLNNININSRGDEQIKAVDIVDGSLYIAGGNFGSFLYGTDGQPQYSNPKHFIIEKAIRYTVSGGTDPLGYPSIDFQTLSALKFPPVYSPTFEYGTDINFSQNFLWRGMFQFMYRYVYDNKSKSCFSSFSQIACILNNEAMDGKNVFDIEVNNLLNITINSGHHTVTDIEIAVQIGNTGIWGVFKSINKAEAALANDTNFVVEYRGNESLLVVPEVDLFNFDLLPTVAGSQKYSSANTLIYSRINEGRTNPEMDLSAEWVHNKVFVPSFNSGTYTIALLAPGDPLGDFSWYPADLSGVVGFPLGTVSLPVGTTIVFKVSLASDCTTGGITDIEYISYTIQAGDFTGANDDLKLRNMLNNMAIYFTSIGYDSEAGTGPPIPGIGDYSIGFRCIITVSVPTTAVSNPKYKTFKQGCFHKFSNVYKGEGQVDGGVTSDAFEIYLPYGSESLPSGFTAYDFYQTLMRMSVANTPPDWATSWCPVLQERSGMGAQMQRTLRGTTAIGSRIRLDLERYYFDTFQATYNFTPEEGDSVRIIQLPDTALTVPKWSDINVGTQLSVIQYLPGGGIGGTDAILVEMFDASTILSSGTLIEISKIKKTSDKAPYYELGLEFPILDPHTPDRRHGGGFAYNGIVEQAGSLGGNLFRFTGDFATYQNMIGRTIVMNNSAGEEQTTTISNVIDNSPLVRIVTTDVFLYNYQNANGGVWKILADQTDLMPAEVMLNGIDTYLRSKTMGIYLPGNSYGTFIVEDDNLSNYYDSQYYDKGRVHAYDKNNVQKEKPNFHRASLPFYEGSEVNQLNKFIAGEEASGPFDRGAVVATYMRGETLRVFQEKKVYSIPINRQVGYLPSGQNQYLFSDANLGPQDDGSGISGPYSQEATIIIGTDIYYLDVLNKQFMKDTMGGPVPLNGKMNQFWITTCREILRLPGQYTIRMGHSMATKELFITISGPFLDFTISLSTETNKWLTFYSFVPDMYLHGNERLFSINPGTGVLFEHNIGAPNDFFGTPHESIIEFFTHVNPEQDKRFLSLFAAINAVPEIEIFADPTELQTAGIYSTAFPVLRNDGYWADVNMNALTPGYSNQNIALAEGFPCQNPWFKVKITTPEGIAFVLRYVDLYFNLINEYK